MSASSRGALLPRQFGTTRIIHGMVYPMSFQQSQLFSSAVVLRAVKKSQPSKPLIAFPNKIQKSQIKSTQPLTPNVYQSFETVLAKRSRPTILYQAPSHTGFMFGSYVAGGFCLLYSGTSFATNYIMAPPGLVWWVPVAFGGISFGMCVLGTYLCLAPSGIVKTITAIPRLVPQVLGTLPKKAIKSQPPDLQLEVEVKKMLPIPFIQAKKLYIRPGEIVLPAPLAPGRSRRVPIAGHELREQRLQAEMAKQKELEYEKTHIMSAGFRHPLWAFRQAFSSYFQGTKRAFFREGFMKIIVNNRKYKLDLTGGWVLDEGKALDRLSVIKPRL